MEKQFDAGSAVAAPVFAGFEDHDEVQVDVATEQHLGAFVVEADGVIQAAAESWKAERDQPSW